MHSLVSSSFLASITLNKVLSEVV